MANDIAARLYVRLCVAAAEGLPVIVFAHGGGFMSGDLDTHDVLVRAIANRCVTQFFKDKAKDTQYLTQMRDRATDADVQSVLIMIDVEGWRPIAGNCPSR